MGSYEDYLNAKKKKSAMDQLIRASGNTLQEEQLLPVSPSEGMSDAYVDYLNAKKAISIDSRIGYEQRKSLLDDIGPTKKTSQEDIGPTRDASFWDLTWRSAERGFYNAILGEEYYKSMFGEKNEKDLYEDILGSDEYNFAPSNKFERAFSGANELVGQMIRQFSNPTTMGFVGSAATAAAIAGQAGPQVALGEEIITVPGAAIAAFTTASAAENLKIEAGHAYNEMLNAGISEKTAAKVAVAVGTANAGLELMQVDELVNAYKVLSKSGATKTVAQKILEELAVRGVDVLKETAQEVAQEGVTILGTQAASKYETGEWAYSAGEVGSRLRDTAESSALSFAALGVPATVSNTTQAVAGDHKANALTETEQAVKDKIVEKRVTEKESKGQPLTKAEKADIEKEVDRELRKGYLTADEIESVLGGEDYDAFKGELETFFNSEDYQSYKESEKKATELQKQVEELGGKKDATLMEQVQFSESLKSFNEHNANRNERKARLDEEAKRLSEIRNKMRSKVTESIRNTRLEESYRELARSKQKFTADVSTYTNENAKRTVQNILDSGLGDNTNQFHETVDFLAKLSEDRGMTFGLTDNEHLRGTEHYKEGYITHGFVTDDGDVTLNMDSPRALNVTVGHEITHTLEKTTSYKDLQNLQEVLFNYAISKEGIDKFNARLKDAEATYKGKANTTPEGEVMADLIGEYVFTDYDFVHSLSTQNRNVFQKVYDEIKYLCKIATAGSKEARELEKAKRLFAKVYRENVKGKPDTQVTEDTNEQVDTEEESEYDNDDVQYSVSVDESAKILEGGSVAKYSLSTWTPEMQAKVRDNLTKAGFEEADVDKWIKDTNGIAAKIAEDKARLDFEAHENHTMVKDNNEYYKTVEASTLCAKRLEYQGTFDAIQHRLPNTTLTSDMLIELRELMKKHGRDVPCGACYVESRRRHLGKYATDWLKSYDGEYIPTLADVTTTDGLEKLRLEHPDTYNDFIAAMNKKGVSNPKVVELRTEYKGEIMKITKATYEKIMKIGGLRLQSFSDFETPHLLDMMQVVHDMASRKFVSQAYTKVPNFAWVLGDTNIKINLSLIPGGTGIDANGELIFDPKEGMDINEAMRLRDRYSKNVGTTIIGINDEHILKCMADDRIDYIIPFHRSGWGATELSAMGLDSYVDYTKQQRERDIVTKKGVDNIDEMSYWDFAKTGKENAEAYLQLCAEKGVIPKFDSFLVDNGDGSYSLQPDGSTDGYWKTLINFKMYDNDGVGSPHQAVVPNFNMEEAYRVLNEYKGGANQLPVADEVVEEFVAKYEEVAPTQYSMTKSDTDYMDAVNRGDMETVQKMVDEAAKNAGYDSEPLYHGTQQFGFTKIDVGESDDGMSFFATDSLEVARTYSASDDPKRISDEPTGDVDGLVEEYYDHVNDFVSFVNRAAGVYNFMDYADSKLDELRVKVEEGLSDYEDVAASLDSYIEEIVHNLYEQKSYYDEELMPESFFESEEVEELYKASDPLYGTLYAIANFDGGTGNYQLYANTEGLFEIDAKGNRWNKIPFDQHDPYGMHPIVDTRMLARYAKAEGYKGVKITNVFDDGGRSVHYQRKPATVYIFFDPQSQVKSADPVTYDESGNVIPLSERFNKENNDIRYSMSKDDQGRSLSNAQKEFFKDSKVTDENGNLKAVYHGSPKDFNTFSLEYLGTNGTAEGYGFYFTDKKDIAENYSRGYEGQQNGEPGKLFECYLDIKKPLSDTEVTMTRAQFRKFLTELNNQVDEDGDPLDVLSNYGDVEWEGLNKVLNYAMEIEYDGSDSDVNLVHSIINGCGNMKVVFDVLRKTVGYDGIIVNEATWGDDQTIYIAFHPEQIKNVDNMNPTSDPDIRFSMSKVGAEENTYGDYHVYGRNFGDNDPLADFAPVAETATVQEKTQLTEENSTADEPEAVESDPEVAEPDIAPDVNGSVKTVRDRLTAKKANSQKELDNNRRLREEASKSFDEQIAKLRAVYDSKKNKNTKVANNLLRRIERLQRRKADVDAGYAKRISDIESRIRNTDKEIEKYHPYMDEYEKTVARINRILEMDKAELEKEFAKKREQFADRDSYISAKASELYKEIRNLKKGVKASEQLGYLLDHGYDWSAIRAALVNIRHTPGETVNINSEAESVAREMLSDDFEQAQVSLEDEYQQRLSEMEAEADEKKEAAQLGHIRIKKNEEHTTFWENLIGDTSTWVDLPLGLAYKTKTLRRILRKVVRDENGKPDFQKADAIYDALEVKYDHNEALLKREAQKLKEVFVKLNLNHKEDTYAQMLGELRHNPETTLTEDAVKEYYEKNKKHINEDKVNKAIDESRKLYDELLIRVNEVLRAQGMKEIPYRKGYFPHFTNPKQNWLQKALNWKPIDNEIPTSIAGLTEMFDPQRSWQSFNKERKGDTTDYSLYQGLDTYIHGALDWIYHIDDLQSRRSLENLIRYTHSEEGIKAKVDKIRADTNLDADEMQTAIEAVLKAASNPLNGLVTELRSRTNTLANKKHSLDRATEEMTSRKIYSTLTNLNSRINANHVVGSISAALTNFIPITQSWVQVSPYYTVAGLRGAVQSAIVDDGMVAKSDFLTNRLVNEEKLYKTGWDKASDKVSILMEAVDNISSQTVWRSKYLQNVSEGMSEAEAIKNADQFAKNLMAGRSRGNAPSLFDAKNPVAKLFTAFQLEVANQYGYMFEDAPQDSTNKARLIKGYATAFIGAYAYNALYSTLAGRDAAFDPIGIMEDLLKDLFGGDDDDEENTSEALLKFAKNVAEEVPFIGGLLGGGRVPMSSAFPYSNVNNPVETFVDDFDSAWNKGKPLEGDWSDLAQELLKPLYYLALPMGGGQLRKTNQGLAMFSEEHPIAGSYTSSGKLRFPVEDTFGNRLKAGLFGQYASKNAQDYFDGGYAPLDEEQIAEYEKLDIPIQQYWEIQEGLRGKSKIDEKADFIDDLDLPVVKKNILINNRTDRKDYINLSGYSKYDDFEEFDFAVHEPEKYEVALTIGGFDKYMTHTEAMKDMDKLAEKIDYIANLDDMTTEQKNAFVNSLTDRKEPIDLTGYEDYGSYDEWDYATKYPKWHALAKSVGGYEAYYNGYYQVLKDIESDKDQYGNTISGSRKPKVKSYVYSLDIPDIHKHILFKSQFNADDSHNKEILDYLNNNPDLSYEEKVYVLDALGAKVLEDGTVKW